MRKKTFLKLLCVGLWGLMLVESSFALPKGIQKKRMEVTQAYKEKNVYGKDIYQGIIRYTHKNNALGYIIPMVTVYNKTGSVVLQAFTYIDFTKVDLIKGAYVEFSVYTPFIDSYDKHKIELFLVEEKLVNNYETVVATQTLFANSIAERRRTKSTATAQEIELFNKHRRNLTPPMEPGAGFQEADKRQSANRSGDTNEIDWNSPFTYGFKWGGFDKKDNFLKY